MITATPFLAAAADAKLEDWGPLDEATGEPMNTSGTTLWSGDGAQEAGVWECMPGPSRWSLDAQLVAAARRRLDAKADVRHPGTARTRSYGVDAAFMSLLRHG